MPIAGTLYGGLACNPGMDGSLRPGWQTAELNQLAYFAWLDEFVQVALSQFSWEGLPDSIDPRFVEWCLLYYGNCCLFDMSADGSGQIAAQPCTWAGPGNLYLNPTEVLITPITGELASLGAPWTRHASWWGDPSGEVRKPDCVVIFDSLTRYPVIQSLTYYARSCADLDRTLDVHLSQLVMPWIGTCDERQRSAIVNYYKQITGHEPCVVVADRSTITEDLRVLDTRVDYIGSDLLDAQARRADQAFTRLGVQNGFTNKKERLIRDEQASNDEQIMLLRKSRMDARQRAADQAREVLGLNLKVRWSVDRDADGQVDMGQMSGGDSDAGTAPGEDNS